VKEESNTVSNRPPNGDTSTLAVILLFVMMLFFILGFILSMCKKIAKRFSRSALTDVGNDFTL
jgi:hypothetical protein